MRSSVRALGLAGAIFAVMLAALLLCLAIGGEDFAAWFGGVLGETAGNVISRALLALTGTALLLADTALILRALGLGATRVIEFESPTGRMVVDVSNLEQCLRRTALEDPDVTDAVASIRIPAGRSSKPIVCRVDVGLHERADVPGKGKELSAQISRRFLQVIPMEPDPVVNLNIRVRPPRPGPESDKATQPMPVAGTGAEAGPEEPPTLPDVHEFTGERKYGDEEEAKEKKKGDSDAG